MKKIVLIAVFFLLIFVLAQIVIACQPCSSHLNLEEAINSSDLIILGQRADYNAEEYFDWGGPENINVEIINFLKGHIQGKQITVNSWDGMCPYGIIVDDGTYIMLLELEDHEFPYDDPNFPFYDPYQYDAVNSGCAPNQFLVDGEIVALYDENISFDDFYERTGLEIGCFNNCQPGDEEPPPKDEEPPQDNNFYYIVGLLTIIVAIILISILVVKYKKKISG
ncbi:MAG: hypothetical protein ABID38_01825 [Candidatus Diapherotrites archaeon]